MLKKTVLVVICLMFYIVGCREVSPKGQTAVTASPQLMDLDATIDELSFLVLTECTKNGLKKLFISTLVSPEKEQSFIAEVFLQRLYLNSLISVVNTYEIAALNMAAKSAELNEDSPLPQEWGIDCLLKTNIEIAQNSIKLSVTLLRNPDKKIVFQENRQISDTQDPILTTIKEGSYVHAKTTPENIIWQENFDNEPGEFGIKYGNWVIQNGSYTPVVGDETLYSDKAIISAPMQDLDDVTFEGDCQLTKNSEGGLIVRAEDPDTGVYVIFSTKHKTAGFIKRFPGHGKWLSPPTFVDFPEDTPFHFKVITNGENYFLFIDSMPVLKVRYGRFKSGTFGVYVYMKESLPVLWDNLLLSK